MILNSKLALRLHDQGSERIVADSELWRIRGVKNSRRSFTLFRMTLHWKQSWAAAYRAQGDFFPLHATAATECFVSSFAALQTHPASRRY
jgi:hypothetical protein